MEAYEPLMVAMARKFSAYAYDESMDESRMILMESIRTYDKTKGSFGNHLKNRLRYHYLDKGKVAKELSLDVPNEEGTPLVETLVDDSDLEALILKKDYYQDLYKAIARLDKKDRKIVRMKYWQNMTNQAIGDALAISPKTVANRMSMALAKLRVYLGELA